MKLCFTAHKLFLAMVIPGWDTIEGGVVIKERASCFEVGEKVWSQFHVILNKQTKVYQLWSFMDEVLQAQTRRIIDTFQADIQQSRDSAHKVKDCIALHS